MPPSGNINDSAPGNLAQRFLVFHTDNGITHCVYNVSEESCITRNGHANIWKGELFCSPGNHHNVAVKVLRGHFQNNAELNQMLRRRMHDHANVWSRLHNEHVSKLFAYHSYNGSPVLIVPYLRNGGIINYLKTHTHMSIANKFIMVKGIVAGLAYLHSEGVIHGNIHAENIMVDDFCRAVLCDVGVDHVMRSIYEYYPVHPEYRVKAPELLSPGTNTVVHPTLAADVYSLGHVVQEMFTLKRSFPEVKNEVTFLIKLASGQLTNTRPVEISTSIWNILEGCWAPRPQDRPTSSRLLEQFELVQY